jgi:hypothetical protein
MSILRLLIFTLLFLIASPAMAQQCTLSIEAPESTEEVAVVAKVLLNGAAPANAIRFRWSISRGTIVSGQDSNQITIDTVALEGAEIEVSVEPIDVSTCRIEAKHTIKVTRRPFVCGMAFDWIGKIRFEDMAARLDNYAIQLQNHPTTRGAIIADSSRPKERKDYIRRVRNYLTKVRRIPSERLVFIEGNRREFMITLHVVPEGASLPTP